MSQDNIDRRKYPRIKKNLPLAIATGNYDLMAETKDISSSGAYCFVGKPIRPMTKLAVELDLVTIKIRCQGIVVRTEKIADYGYNIAIFFNDISETDRNKLSQYINQHMSL